MPWTISVAIDADKTISPAVGTATATFIAQDGSTFTFGHRDSFTAAAADKFVADAIAARNDWANKQRTAETSAVNSLVTKFTTAGETATAAPVK